MANLLNVAMIESIQALHAQQWSARRIARELGVDRETVGKYLRRGSCDSKPANLPTGSAGSKPATLTELPAGDSKPASGADRIAWRARSSQSVRGAPRHDRGQARGGAVGASHSAGPGRRRNHGPLRRAAALSPSPWTEPGTAVSPAAVPRRRRSSGRLRHRRTDRHLDGRRRKTHVFRIVLSHSRKAYSEATFTQTTDDFLRALENAFRHFGGVPQDAGDRQPEGGRRASRLVRSRVGAQAAIVLPALRHGDPADQAVHAAAQGEDRSGHQLREEQRAQRAHVRQPRRSAERHLEHWERTVADTRIHGTTKQQVGKVFAEVERAALVPLPSEPFAIFQEGQRKVNRDGHVEVAKAYYSAPPEYLGRTVWVRWDARLVRIFNHRWEQIAVHVRQEPGRFSTLGEHLAAEKISGLERGAAWLLRRRGRSARTQTSGPSAMLASPRNRRDARAARLARLARSTRH